MKHLSSLFSHAQRCILSLLLLMCTTSAFAAGLAPFPSDTIIDGIKYKLSTNVALNIATIVRSPDAEGDVVIPTSIKVWDTHHFRSTIYSVDNIAADAFKGNEKITSLVLPRNPNVIPTGFLSGCTALKSVKFSSQISSFGEKAFYGCSSLETISAWCRNMTSIRREAFSGCSSLKSLGLSVNGKAVIPEGVTVIERSAFQDCKSLQKVELPDGLIAINSFAFDGCTSLSSVNFPSSLQLIADFAFNMCAALKTMSLPEGLNKIGTFAFSQAGLTSLEIPASVVNFGESAFSKCENLQKITLPSSSTTLSAMMFSSCTSLTTVVDKSESLRATSNALNANSFKFVDLPNVKLFVNESLVDAYKNSQYDWSQMNISQILPEGTFKSGDLYYKVTSPTTVEVVMFPSNDKPADGACIVIPEWIIYNEKEYTVAAIGESAFFTTNIKSVIIPRGVTSIGNYAFNVCSKLESVYCLGRNTTIGSSYVFGSCPNLTIYVSATSVSAYKRSWSTYAGKIQAFPGVTPNSAHYATYSAAFDWKVATPGVKAYKGSVNGTTITLTELTGDYIPRCYGVLLYGDVEKIEIDARDDSDTGSVMNGDDFYGTTCTDGTLSDKPAEGYTFVLGDGEQFLHYTGSEFILNRAYLWFRHEDPTASSKAPLRIANDGSEALGIDQVSTDTDAADGKYMLDGRIVIVKGGVKYDTRGQVVR